MSTEWRRAGSTLWRRTTTGAVVLPAGLEEPIHLTGAAALVWDVLEEPTTTAEVTEILARACGQNVGRIGADIAAVLARLHELGAAERDRTAPC